MRGVSLRLFMELSLGRSVKSEGVCAMSDNWAKKAAETFRAAQEQRETRDAKALLDEKLKRTWAPKKWDELRLLLHSKTDSFNAEAGDKLIWESPRTREAIVRLIDSDTRLTCTYDSEEFSVEIKCSLIGRKYVAEVVKGQVVFADSRKAPVALEQIAEEALDSLLTFLAA